MHKLGWQRFFEFVGVESGAVSHKEKIVSGAGVFVGILFVFLISNLYLDAVGTICLVSSMGASAVLLFGVPHGALSQPWPLVGGHFFSAFIGVCCSKFLRNPLFAAPLAVGLSMVAMHYGRCIHPPGGATALTAVIGGNQVQQLGFKFVLAPLAVNVFILLVVAFAFNAFFKWRRYPACLAERKNQRDVIPRESLAFALRQMNSFIDVSEEDLEQIYTIAERHAAGSRPKTPTVRVVFRKKVRN